MKKEVWLALVNILAFLLILWVLQKSHRLGDNTLPPIGPFFSPSHGFWQNAEPHRYKDIHIKTVSSSKISAKIVMDDRLVPYIFAADEPSAAYAQGLLHAKYRLWQIDISLRDVSGTLSEVLGERTLQRDIKTRREGFVWAVEQNATTYLENPLVVELFEAYLDGFNTYLDQLKPSEYPIEFKLLNYAPKKLTLKDMIFLSKNLVRTLTMKEYDVQNSFLKEHLGEELFEFLFPIYQPDISPVYPIEKAEKNQNGFQFIENPISVSGSVGYIFEDDDRSHASNNWAINGPKTKNGYPILCNDPHLNLTLPSIWYETAIITPGYKVRGVSLAGIPSVVIGFNEYMAWGFTNGGHDVLDWVKIDWVDPENGLYLSANDTLRAVLREEKIDIRGKESHIEKIWLTQWGPVTIESTEHDYDLAMHWTGHHLEVNDEVLVFYKLNMSQNIEEARSALRSFPAPIQNCVLASINGEIAIQSTGLWPWRNNRSGMFVSSSSDQDISWKGYVPYDDIPRVVNPQSRYVSSANQHSTLPNTFKNLYFGYFESFRGRILNRYLDSIQGAEIKDMMKLQLSNYSLKAEESLPVMLRVIERSQLEPNQLDILDSMQKWDYSYEANSWEAAIFDVWYDQASMLSFDECVSHRDPSKNRLPEKWVLSYILNHHIDHSIFDIKETADTRETATEILTLAFQKALKALGYEDRNSPISWKDFLQPTIAHLGRIKAFDVAVNVGGSKDALNAMSSGGNGPSWRMVVELSPKGPVAYGVYPGGQSGNPGSKFYDNFIAHWSNGQYYPLLLPQKPEELNSRLFEIKFK